MDLSGEMLAKLKQKAPDAKVIRADIINYAVQEQFDYIFIPSGSISLFTDMMDEYLRACGFKNTSVYSGYRKEPAVNDRCEMFLYECSQAL